MRVLPISFDSMGTRSMCIYVETSDVKIIVDPGVSLAPVRYGLPPHSLEIEKMKEDWEKILEYGCKADILIVTHYHYDHHNPDEGLDMYDDKIVFIKNPRVNINLSQKLRAAYFLERMGSLPYRLEEADGGEYVFGSTRIKFSKPVFHGTNPRLGYILEVLIDNGVERLVYTSDVEGPSLDDQVNFMIESKPTMAFVDGPMTYMLGYRYPKASLDRSIENLYRLMDGGHVKTLILDHHLLRDLAWMDRMKPLLDRAGKIDVKVMTAAEFIGRIPSLLEAKRRELYELYPEKPSRRWRIREE
ncbi:MAG: hypothetical protein RMJ00_03325 [Nitrososphaerota archaeon]|nr:hypothetical protein [Candidatus Bathyarchaeota archaeon]MDW8061709.1 hypothetical protein [Nitrososphaerota archaeon]